MSEPVALRADSFRFRPPLVEIPTEVRWALGRAFAPAHWLPPEKVDPREALSWVLMLGLETRIAYRSSPEQVALELETEAAKQLLRSRHQSVARGMLLQELLEKVAICGAELEIPLVVLKGVALLESGVSAPGSRMLGDLDVLVPAGRAQGLARRLLEEGFETTTEGESSHHLPPLTHPTLGLLEIHHQVSGLSTNGSGNATAEDLIHVGLCQESPRLSWVKVPIGRVLAAHAIVHALDQHGRTPRIYPPTRMVGDLLDLAADEGEEIGSFVMNCGRYIRHSFSERELRAVADLCHHLAQGSAEGLTGDCGAILRHTVAGFEDSRYCRSLKRSAVREALGRRDWKKFKRRLWNSPRPSENV